MKWRAPVRLLVDVALPVAVRLDVVSLLPKMRPLIGACILQGVSLRELLHFSTTGGRCRGCKCVLLSRVDVADSVSTSDRGCAAVLLPGLSCSGCTRIDSVAGRLAC